LAPFLQRDFLTAGGEATTGEYTPKADVEAMASTTIRRERNDFIVSVLM
jgi:hypothetical protein